MLQLFWKKTVIIILYTKVIYDMNQQQLKYNYLIESMYRSTRLIICQIYNVIQQAILYVSFGRRQYANPHKQSILKYQNRAVSLNCIGRSNIINYKSTLNWCYFIQLVIVTDNVAFR